MIGPTCRCGAIHAAIDVMAVGRFNPRGVHGFRPRLGGTLRLTRAEAMLDVCAEWKAS